MRSGKDLIIAVMIISCFAVALFMVSPTRSNPGSTTSARQSVDPPSSYDSGWLNITNKCGQNITITHNLNSTNIIVDIQGKTTLNSGPHQKNYGLAAYTSGWSKAYGGTAFDWAHALVQTTDGGYALAGLTASFGAGSLDFWLVKTDAAGNMQWNKTYGGTGDDEAWALVQTTDGGYALAGYTTSFGAGSADFWLVKTDVESGLAWIDSSANTLTLYRGATDAYWNFVRVTITIRSSASLFLVVRGEDNGIYYRLFNESTSTWNAWEKLPGATPDSPAAAIVGNQLRVVVRGMDGSSLWYGTIYLASDTFSGWTQLSGASPSAPELASTGTTPP